jgi:hypothetical protein
VQKLYDGDAAHPPKFKCLLKCVTCVKLQEEKKGVTRKKKKAFLNRTEVPVHRQDTEAATASADVAIAAADADADNGGNDGDGDDDNDGHEKRRASVEIDPELTEGSDCDIY